MRISGICICMEDSVTSAPLHALTHGDMRQHTHPMHTIQNPLVTHTLVQEIIGNSKSSIILNFYSVHYDFNSSPGRRWRHGLVAFQKRQDAAKGTVEEVHLPNYQFNLYSIFYICLVEFLQRPRSNRNPKVEVQAIKYFKQKYLLIISVVYGRHVEI